MNDTQVSYLKTQVKCKKQASSDTLSMEEPKDWRSDAGAQASVTAGLAGLIAAAQCSQLGTSDIGKWKIEYECRRAIASRQCQPCGRSSQKNDLIRRRERISRFDLKSLNNLNVGIILRGPFNTLWLLKSVETQSRVAPGPAQLHALYKPRWRLITCTVQIGVACRGNESRILEWRQTA